MNPIKQLKPRGTQLTRWRPRNPLQRWEKRGRPGGPLALAAGGVTLALSVAATAVLLGGVVILGMGALAIGGMLVTGYWFRAQRNGIWVHVLVDSDDAVISLAMPIPLGLIRWGLRRAPLDDDAAAMARLILEDPELLETLRHDAIEIVVDDGPDHIEVVIGPRRKRWRSFQFKPIRTHSQTHSQTPSVIFLEESHHVR